MQKSNFFKNKKCYLIAEIGVNHEGSIKKAKDLILSAKRGGANCVKFQTYKAKKIASKNSPAYWDLTKENTESQYKLFKKFDKFNYNDYLDLYKFCKINEIEFLTTPFDLESIDELDNLLNFYKISSSDITNIPLIEKIISKKKPIIISTGASNLSEIDEIYEKFLGEDIEFCLMHCVLSYPTANKDANLHFIKKMKNRYPDCTIGYSDHTLPNNEMSVLTSAYLLGANIIEKHFTDNKFLYGNDHYHSMDEKDLIKFKSQINLINELLGFAKFRDVLECELIPREKARRSLYYSKNLKKGDIIDEDNIIAKRPSGGISPSNLKLILGKRINKNVLEDNFVNLDDLD